MLLAKLSCTNPQNIQALQPTECPQLLPYPAWTATKRPASSNSQDVVLKVPVAKLQNAVTDMLVTKQAVAVSKVKTCLQGRLITLKSYLSQDLAVKSDDDVGAGPVKLRIGVFMMVGVLEAGALSVIKSTTSVDTAQAAQSSISTLKSTGTAGYQVGSSSRGFYLVSFSSVSSWSDHLAHDVEKLSRQHKLVHEDECLHIRVQLLEVM